MSVTRHQHQDLIHVERYKDLSSLHYYRFAVSAERYVVLKHQAQALALYAHPEWSGEAMVLGEGSNVLITQDEVPGWVISWQGKGIQICSESSHEVVVTVGAGMLWDDLVAYAVSKGWGGLACLSAIPGTVGAAVVQNIGAYGVELADCLVSCRSLHLASGRYKVWPASACQCGYRSSVFKSCSEYLVVEVTLKLSKAMSPAVMYDDLEHYLSKQGVSRPTLDQLRQAVVAVRQQKLPDPVCFPNTGSFFKNPVVSQAQLGQLQCQWPEIRHWPLPHGVKLSAAWLIEACGLKGFRMGGVSVSLQHALVLVHHGDEAPAMMLSLVRHVQACVRGRFGIDMQPEVGII